jgi:hypothetical protein
MLKSHGCCPHWQKCPSASSYSCQMSIFAFRAVGRQIAIADQNWRVSGMRPLDRGVRPHTFWRRCPIAFSSSRECDDWLPSGQHIYNGEQPHAV